MKHALPVVLSLLLIIHIAGMNIAVTQSTLSIDDRIDLALTWLDYRWVAPDSEIGYYLDSNDTEISLEDNSFILNNLAMYSRVYTSTEYLEKIKSLIALMLSSQRKDGSFATHIDHQTGRLYGVTGLPVQNAYLMESLAFSSFQVSYLKEEDEIYFDAVKAVELCIDHHSTSLNQDGSWKLKYADGEEYEDLSGNSAILVALLYTAIFEQYWGDTIKAQDYALKAQKTLSWILKQQETREDSWGYGGFYSEGGKEQLFEANSFAVYALTSYMRIILSIDDSPEPSLDEIRWSLRTWHDKYLITMIDHYGAPYYTRTVRGVQQYPMNVRSSGLATRALVEAWVVLGDRKFKDSATIMSRWMTGVNQNNQDMQIDGGFIEGYASQSQLDKEQHLMTTSKALLGLIYSTWINIRITTATETSVTVSTSTSMSSILPTSQSGTSTGTEDVENHSIVSNLGLAMIIVIIVIIISGIYFIFRKRLTARRSV